jgi:hypothetical protein
MSWSNHDHHDNVDNDNIIIKLNIDVQDAGLVWVQRQDNHDWNHDDWLEHDVFHYTNHNLRNTRQILGMLWRDLVYDDSQCSGHSAAHHITRHRDGHDN